MTNFSKDNNIKNIIIEIIIIIIKDYKMISNNNTIINSLIGFFFDVGNINKNDFLIPKTESIKQEKIEYESFNDVAKKIFEFEFNKFDIKSKKKFLIIILIIILSFWIVF